MPMNPANPARSHGWTAAQQSVLIALAAALLAYASVLAVWHRASITDPPPPQGSRAHLLLTRLDPNTAPAHELAMIPQIGPVRASAIVEYRQRIQRFDPSAIPFTRPEDLLRVKGIGVSLMNHMRPHLMFPPPQSPPGS